VTLAAYLAARPPRANPPLTSLPHVVGVFDTRVPARQLPGFADAGGGAQVAYHVTDDPDRLLRAVARRVDVVAAYGPRGQYAELGPGLYLTHVPNFWTSRSQKKWAFLDAPPRGPGRLLAALRAEVAELVRTRYVSASEAEYVERIMDAVASGTYSPSMLTELSVQPYNVEFWRAPFLRKAGLTPTAPPRVLEVAFAGSFARLDAASPGPTTLRTLRRAGLQGVFTDMGFSTNPELVLWDARSVREAREIPWAWP
jgi:hypothetical protein